MICSGVSYESEPVSNNFRILASSSLMIVFTVILRLELVAAIEELLYLVLANRGWFCRRWSDAYGEETVGHRAYRLSSGGITSFILLEQ